jgi:hypothetical protein
VYATTILTLTGPASGGLPPQGNLLKSFDGGLSWETVEIVPSEPVPFQVLIDPSGSLVYAVTHLGLYASNGGAGPWPC